MKQRGGSLDECVKMLSGSNDEQRLVGALLATKFVEGDDIEAVRKIFDALGFEFVDRLIKTGLGQLRSVPLEKDQQEAYLHLGISILSAFCRLPELASGSTIINSVPIIVETLSSRSDSAVCADCFESLIAISVASQHGLFAVCDAGIFSTISNHLLSSGPGDPQSHLALKLFHLLAGGVVSSNKLVDYGKDVVIMVSTLVKLISTRQDQLKFEALNSLSSLFAARTLTPCNDTLNSSAGSTPWPEDVRTGLGQILHSNVAALQKQQALELAASMVELLGTSWLIGQISLPDNKFVPSDRFLFLLVGAAKVEIAVILNEISRQAQISGVLAGESYKKAGNLHPILATSYAIMENVIDLICDIEGQVESLADGSLQKIVIALDETVGIILEFLEDAKDLNVNQGDVLLASVRLIGRYLAEVPSAHKKCLFRLLVFLLSIRSEHDERSQDAVRFLVPVLCQLTVENEGCEVLLACNGHKQVLGLVTALLQDADEDHEILFHACDILSNVLLKKDNLLSDINAADFFVALPLLASWAGHKNREHEIAQVASLCVLVLSIAEEDALSVVSEVDIQKMCVAVVKGLEECNKENMQENLLEIMTSGCMLCLQKYHFLEKLLKMSSCICHPKNRYLKLLASHLGM